MKVRVRVFGYLRTFCSRKTSEEFIVDVPQGSTVQDLLIRQEIPAMEDVMVVVNNVTVSKGGHALQEQDSVLIYPFLGGG